MNKFILLINLCLIILINVNSHHCFSQNRLLQKPDTTFQQNDKKFILPSPLIENAGPDIPRPKPIIDTFSFKYNFRVGDTLIYAVMSKDSITIDYGPPLLRIRFEKIMLTCDSITPKGHYVIKQQLIDFQSKESYLKEKNVERNTTAWLNVPVYIEIDSLGNRHKQYNKDSLRLAMKPGEAFQPFILLPLNMQDSTNIKYTNESWMLNDSSYIYENGNPAPVFRYTLYYRMIGMIDTLDLGKLLKMTFSMTSQSAHKVNTDDIKILTTAINNAGGEIFWDTIKWIPKYYIHTIEQRLTIENKINMYKELGFHYIHSTFILDKFVAGKDKKTKQNKKDTLKTSKKL